VHCGFCLQACPTYLALGDENDSPRGRIVLMRALVEGTLAADDPTVGTHIDRCLGCRGCETACPSGVPYGHLLEATRATLARTRPIPVVGRIVLRVFATRALLVRVLWLARALRATRLPAALARMPGMVGQALAMLAATEATTKRQTYTARGTGGRGTVAVLRGCVMDGLFGETNRATERVLVVNDYAIVPAPGQRCCGALHAHAGDARTARELAKANVAAFERSGAAWIAVNAAGCGAMVKEYGALLEDDPAWAARAAAVSARARDVTELLAAAGPKVGASIGRSGSGTMTGGTSGRTTSGQTTSGQTTSGETTSGETIRVAYDAPCHLQHAQRVTAAPVAVLRAVAGIELVPLVDADQCCGSAGIYNLMEPALAATVLRPKLERVAESGAALVATGNPGCLMQIGAGLRRAGRPVRTVHPVDLLDASYAARPDPFI
jgi:glycolate dehydrogenase iron-sulfur subunit